MSYKCNICDLKISDGDLKDPEWCCGRCEGFDDWTDLDKVRKEEYTANEYKKRFEAMIKLIEICHEAGFPDKVILDGLVKGITEGLDKEENK